MMQSLSWRRFMEDQRGNVAMTFSVAVVAILAVIGAGMDYTMTSSSQSKAQNIADAIALNAAVQVRNNNDKIPTSSNDQGIKAGDYKASDFGYAFDGWVDGGAENVSVNVAYDTDTREAIVTVRGRTVASFSKIMGFDSLDFSTQSVVSFESTELNDVASIALVLDNSGSMAWDDKAYIKNGNGNGNGKGEWKPDPNAVSRISALENSVNSFMDHLGTLVGDQSGSNAKIVRTGMLAYNTGTITARTKTMRWDLLSQPDVNSMIANGGTNSSSSMKIARNWMRSENAIHVAANGKTPLKYVVFMTDGVNNNNGSTWVEASGGGVWRRVRCTFERRHRNRPHRWDCYTQEKTQTNKPSGSVGRLNRNTAYDYPWIEGRITMPDNEETLGYCQDLKDAGTTVYTIGFALEAGTYGGGSWSSYPVSQDAESTQIAYDFLKECASGPTYFIAAENAEDLNDAFDTIGEEIVAEVVRIKS